MPLFKKKKLECIETTFDRPYKVGEVAIVKKDCANPAMNKLYAILIKFGPKKNSYYFIVVINTIINEIVRVFVCAS